MQAYDQLKAWESIVSSSEAEIELLKQITLYQNFAQAENVRKQIFLKTFSVVLVFASKFFLTGPIETGIL